MITLEKVKQRAESDAKTYGYFLNPDPAFLNDLLEGLRKNEERYGYPACPCRIATGQLELDRDIICPCDYRDPDVAEYGTCYCALYVRKDIIEGKAQIQPIPERRPKEKQERAYSTGNKPAEPEQANHAEIGQVRKKLWYCKQCGYVVYREDPPYVCPICKAKRELFSPIELRTLPLG